MKVATNPPLYWKVCLINGAVFIGAATLLVVSPATVSHRVTGPELAVLATGLVVILATNAALLHSTLAPLDRLIGLLDKFQPDAVGRRLPSYDRGVAAMLAASFNDLLKRLEVERATRSARELAAQEAERQRIAQELHDEVGQRLTVVLLGLKRALDRLPPDAAGELGLVQENARTSLEEVRRVARGLRPGVLQDLGLVPALKAMVSEFWRCGSASHHRQGSRTPRGARCRKSTRADPRDPRGPHQLGHRLARHLLPGLPQVGQDPRRAVGGVRLAVMVNDLGRQVGSPLLRRAGPDRLPADPVVVARPGHLEQPGHPGDLECGLLRLHQPVGLYRF
jgi:hypothetical protein